MRSGFVLTGELCGDGQVPDAGAGKLLERYDCAPVEERTLRQAMETSGSSPQLPGEPRGRRPIAADCQRGVQREKGGRKTRCHLTGEEATQLL